MPTASRPARTTSLNCWVGENICNPSGQIEHETRFAYDGDEIILQFNKDFSTPVAGPVQMTNASLTDRYLWQPNAVDQLMADEQVTTPNALGNVVYPLADHECTIHDLAVATLNSSTGQMNTTVVNHIVFDAFGNELSSTNPSSIPSSTPTATCLFGYTGRPADPAKTGLQDNDNRWYSPEAMRWISQDPLGYDGGDANLYQRHRCRGEARLEPGTIAEHDTSGYQGARRKLNDGMVDVGTKLKDKAC